MIEQWLRQNKLVGSYCKKCDVAIFPPRSMCPHCRGPMETVDIPKKGVVITHSEVYISTRRFPTPYHVAIVKFDKFQLPAYALEPVEIGEGVEWTITYIGDKLWYAIRKSQK
ncbi:MAG: Zn-ribbon domain-containing OB-fold protein [Pyrobaculum sp.]